MQLPLDFCLSLEEGRILRLLDADVPYAADRVFHGLMGRPRRQQVRAALRRLLDRGLARHTCLGWTATPRGKQAVAA